MSTSSGRPPRLSAIVAARLTAGLSLILGALTLVSHRPHVLLAACSMALALTASIMLLHQHSKDNDVDRVLLLDRETSPLMQPAR